MFTDWASPDASRTVTPPIEDADRTWCRVTGTVAASRSSTFTPAELQPTMTALLSTRLALEVSREAVIVEPFSSVPAQAMDRRMTSFGAYVDVGEPGHARPAEQRPRASRLPDDRRVHDRAGLDGLERVDLHVRGDHGACADEALFAEDHTLFAVNALAQVT